MRYTSAAPTLVATQPFRSFSSRAATGISTKRLMLSGVVGGSDASCYSTRACSSPYYSSNASSQRRALTKAALIGLWHVSITWNGIWQAAVMSKRAISFYSSDRLCIGIAATSRSSQRYYTIFRRCSPKGYDRNSKRSVFCSGGGAHSLRSRSRCALGYWRSTHARISC